MDDKEMFRLKLIWLSLGALGAFSMGTMCVLKHIVRLKSLSKFMQPYILDDGSDWRECNSDKLEQASFDIKKILKEIESDGELSMTSECDRKENGLNGILEKPKPDSGKREAG